MPQLDSTIIFTQLFWLILTFSFLYGFFLLLVLPTIVKTLKLRNVLTQLQSTAKETTDARKNELFTSSLNNLQNCLKFCNSQNSSKVKSFVQSDQKISNDQTFFFLQRLHMLLIYNLTK